ALPDPDITTSFTYKDRGELEKRTMSGNETVYEYTARGPVKKTTHPIATITDENSYLEDGSLDKSIRNGAQGFKYGTKNFFDALGRLIELVQLSSPNPGTGDI